jgi:hypothetical protein
MKKINKFLLFTICTVIAIFEAPALPTMAVVQVLDERSIAMGAHSMISVAEKIEGMYELAAYVVYVGIPEASICAYSKCLKDNGVAKVFL